MKKFRFPLEGVSRVRDLAVREREVGLAQAREALAEADEARERMAVRLRRSLEAAPKGTVVPVCQLLEHDAERRRLRVQLKREEERLLSRAAQVEAGRAQLVRARREAQAVEMLRQRRYTQFLYEVMREEQKETDESASRVVRQRRAA
jgi:flagellar FliJ protein